MSGLRPLTPGPGSQNSFEKKGDSASPKKKVSLRSLPKNESASKKFTAKLVKGCQKVLNSFNSLFSSKKEKEARPEPQEPFVKKTEPEKNATSSSSWESGSSSETVSEISLADPLHDIAAALDVAGGKAPLKKEPYEKMLREFEKKKAARKEAMKSVDVLARKLEKRHQEIDASNKKSLGSIEGEILQLKNGCKDKEVQAKLKKFEKKVARLKKEAKITNPVVEQEPVELSKRAALKKLKVLENEWDVLKPKLENYTPTPQANIGNTCYFNSALQCIESVYRRYDRDLDAILKQDLALREDETLEQLEMRLSAWAPIPDYRGEDLTALEAKRADLENQLEGLNRSEVFARGKLVHEIYSIQVKEALIKTKENLKKIDAQLKLDKSPAEKEKLAEDRIFLERRLLARNDRILFKWSYLNLLQAKKYGTPEQITEALEVHHNVCFTIEPNQEFSGRANRTAQLDANGYFHLWQEMLGLQMKGFSYHQGERDGQFLNADGASVIAEVLGCGIKDNFNLSLLDFFIEEAPDKAKASQLDAAITSNNQKIQKLKSKKNKTDDSKEVRTLSEKNKKLKTEKENLVSVKIGKEENPFYDFQKHFRFIGEPPRVLHVQLKRFNNEMKKNDKAVPFGDKHSYNDILQLDKYCDPEVVKKGGADYKLTGIVIHEGEFGWGHYTSYVRHHDDWYFMNDEATPKKVKAEDVPFEDAYMLSYQRIKRKAVED